MAIKPASIAAGLEWQVRPPRVQRREERRNVENVALALVTVSATIAGAGLVRPTLSLGILAFVVASALTVVARRMLRP